MKMIKTNKKLIISIALIIFGILIITNNTYAVVNPDFYDPQAEIEQGTFLDRAGIILGWIKYIGILVSVVTLSILGLKYLFSSVEGKAEYKKTFPPYILGCFLLVGITLVIGIIENIAVTPKSCEWYRDETGNIAYTKCLQCNNIKTDNKDDGKLSFYINCLNCGAKFENRIRKSYTDSEGNNKCSFCSTILEKNWCSKCKMEVE